jgi:hypothetical protein
MDVFWPHSNLSHLLEAEAKYRLLRDFDPLSSRWAMDAFDEDGLRSICSDFLTRSGFQANLLLNVCS